ncbi:MAG: hypothetical protein NVS4B3_26920 [Gemmatimonadaceae bacterium]
MNWTKTVSVAALLFPLAVPGQQRRAESPVPNGITMSFKFIANRYGGWLVTAFDLIPAARYAYRPTPPQQSIGHIAQHLEGANYGLCERFGAMKHPTSARDALPDSTKAAWPKDTLLARLRASLAFCDAALAQQSDATLGDRVPYGPPGSGATALPARSLLYFVTDLAEHYSQLASYMRLIGLVPPSAPRPRTAIDVPAALLAQYVGTYDLPPSPLQDAPAFVLVVTLKDGALYLTPGARPQARLWPETASDFFVKEADAQITFIKAPGGAVTGLVVHQNGENRAASKVR